MEEQKKTEQKQKQEPEAEDVRKALADLEVFEHAAEIIALVRSCR